MSDKMAFDWDEPLRAVNGDGQLLREVVEVLIADLPRLRSAVEAGVAAEDADAIRRAAHSLKGSLRFLGDIPSHQLAQRIENMADAGSLPETSAEWSKLRGELDALTPLLNDFVGSAGR